MRPRYSSLFFFNGTATTQIYTLSLHDALPISGHNAVLGARSSHADHFLSAKIHGDKGEAGSPRGNGAASQEEEDRKSTRLNSSHRCISYAVFCLKKKTKH